MPLNLPPKIMAMAEAGDEAGLLKIARGGSRADRVDAIIALAAMSESKDVMVKVVMRALEGQPPDVVKEVMARFVEGP